MIRSMPLGVFVVAVAFPLAMAALVVAAGLRARRRAAVVRDTPTAFLATAGDGYGQFVGWVEPVDGETIRAPLTGSPCVWFHARVERRERKARDLESRWTRVRDVTSEVPFLIRDDGGVAAVDPFLAEITPTDRSLWYGDHETPQDRDPPRLKPTESTTDVVSVTDPSEFRYLEERIYARDPLLVLGHLSRRRGRDDEDDEDDEDEDEDEDKDLTKDEQQAARLMARASAVTRLRIGEGPGERPFVITTTPRDQHLELTETGSQAAFGIALVPLGLAALLLWTRFG